MPGADSASTRQVSPYFVGEYGFSPDCHAVVWSGDNPCAVAGMRLENAGDACISLGPSDTIFALLGEPSPKTEGHIFGSPLDPDGYMSLICFLNGSVPSRPSQPPPCFNHPTHLSTVTQTAPPRRRAEPVLSGCLHCAAGPGAGAGEGRVR